jgi:hypothetical protein
LTGGNPVALRVEGRVARGLHILRRVSSVNPPVPILSISALLIGIGVTLFPACPAVLLDNAG